MKLNLNQIKDITRGAVDVTYEDGAYRFYRMTSGEYDITEKAVADATASVVLEFKTDALCLRLNVKTELSMEIRSFFAFDIFADGRLIGCIKNYEDDKLTGNYSSDKFEIGSFKGEFPLEKGDKTLKIVMPHTLIGSIEEIELADATYIIPCKKDKLLIAYGDSITQGYDAQHPSKIYATRLGDYLDAEVINKAIGGAVFEYYRVDGSLHSHADYVSVAFGTNDWTVHDADTIRQDVADYMKSIKAKYPDAKKFVITPIWRASADTIKKGGSFYDLEKIITEECAVYSDITVIPGIDLVDHDTGLFGDLGLHPNDDGFDLYAKNLNKLIQ